MSKVNPVVLCILDGFGIAPDSEGNAWTQAKTPTFDTVIKRYPSMALRASGEDVGLSWGEMGNSEVGHLAIGSGRVFYQMLPRIDRDIEQQTFFDNPALLGAIQHAKENKTNLHLVGLVSQGLVHAADTHCHALLDLAKRHKCKKVFIHVILDGRDTDKDAGAEFVTTLQAKMKEFKVGEIASLSGRFYTMDRNQRWDRTETAYQAIAQGVSEKTHTDPNAAIQESYKAEVFDEQFVPTTITKRGKPVVTIEDNDAVIFFNYRPDRARQLTKAFVMPDFDKFKRTYLPNLYFTTMAEYEAGLPVEVAFPPNRIKNSLAEVVSNAGLSQFHISETEKYAHVTFFMNGTREDPFPGEERAIVHSPRVASYDETPAMSTKEVTDRVIKEMKAGRYDLTILNLANPDMVGHTGNLSATVKAIETADECMNRIIEATTAREGSVVITADHGNAEEMISIATGEVSKIHSTNPVPLWLVGKQFEGQLAQSGEVPSSDMSLVQPIGLLADIAPTTLKLLGIEPPEDMFGTALF